MNHKPANFNQDDSIAPTVKLGAIGFINTIPIYTALHQNRFQPKLASYELVYQNPAMLNKMVREGELDISPVSSAYYLANADDLVMLEDVSVSSPGAVESVLFLSSVPVDSAEFLEKTPVIAIPDDTETSVNLLAWLLQQKTGQCVRDRFRIFPANDYEQALSEFGAALVIGDNALRIHEKPQLTSEFHLHDLSNGWMELTELPFVFAVWVARKAWVEQYPEQYAEMNRMLIASRRAFFEEPELFETGILWAKERCSIPETQIRHYFTKALTYTLEGPHQQALSKFADIIASAAKVTA